MASESGLNYVDGKSDLDFVECVAQKMQQLKADQSEQALAYANSEAAQLLNASTEQIEAASIRRESLDHAVQFTFKDGSSIQCRKLSGRSAFSAEGWHIKST